MLASQHRPAGTNVGFTAHACDYNCWLHNTGQSVQSCLHNTGQSINVGFTAQANEYKFWLHSEYNCWLLHSTGQWVQLLASQHRPVSTKVGFTARQYKCWLHSTRQSVQMLASQHRPVSTNVGFTAQASQYKCWLRNTGQSVQKLASQHMYQVRKQPTKMTYKQPEAKKWSLCEWVQCN